MAGRPKMKTGEQTWEIKKHISPLCERVKTLLDENNIDDFCEKLEISKRTVYNWQSHKARPDVDRLVDIARYFNVSTDYLLGATDEPTTDVNIRAFCDYTGLTEKSIETVKEWHESGIGVFCGKRILSIVNTLLSSLDFWRLCVDINRCIVALKQRICIEKRNTDLKFTENTITIIGKANKKRKQEVEEIVMQCRNLKERQGLGLFNIQNCFEALIIEYINTQMGSFNANEYSEEEEAADTILERYIITDDDNEEEYYY